MMRIDKSSLHVYYNVGDGYLMGGGGRNRWHLIGVKEILMPLIEGVRKITPSHFPNLSPPPPPSVNNDGHQRHATYINTKWYSEICDIRSHHGTTRDGPI